MQYFRKCGFLESLKALKTKFSCFHSSPAQQSVASAARCDHFDTLPYKFSVLKISRWTKVRTDGENFLK